MFRNQKDIYIKAKALKRIPQIHPKDYENCDTDRLKAENNCVLFKQFR